MVLVSSSHPIVWICKCSHNILNNLFQVHSFSNVRNLLYVKKLEQGATDVVITNLCKTILTNPEESNGLQTYTMGTFIIGKSNQAVNTIHKTIPDNLIEVFQNNCTIPLSQIIF